MVENLHTKNDPWSAGSRIAKQRTNKQKTTELAAFLPESDNEDEFPPGWEERATLSGQVEEDNIRIEHRFKNNKIIKTNLFLRRSTTQIMTWSRLSGRIRGLAVGKKSLKIFLLAGSARL